MQQDPSLLEHPASSQNVPGKPLEQKHPPRRRWLNTGIGLTATLLVITVLAGLLVPTPHGIGTGSGGLMPAVVPMPRSAATSTPTIFPATPTRER